MPDKSFYLDKRKLVEEIEKHIEKYESFKDESEDDRLSLSYQGSILGLFSVLRFINSGCFDVERKDSDELQNHIVN